MAAGVDTARGIGIIAIRGTLIAGGRVMRVAGMLGGRVVRARCVLVALESEPRHRRRLNRKPGEQHQQDKSTHQAHCTEVDDFTAVGAYQQTTLTAKLLVSSQIDDARPAPERKHLPGRAERSPPVAIRTMVIAPVARSAVMTTPARMCAVAPSVVAVMAVMTVVAVMARRRRVMPARRLVVSRRGAMRATVRGRMRRRARVSVPTAALVGLRSKGNG